MTTRITPAHPALSIDEIYPHVLPIHCPHCALILASASASQIDMSVGEWLYDDGDTIFGLASTLIARGLVAEQDLRDQPATWFDYGFLVGQCPFCEGDYFGATVSMIDPATRPPPGFRETWFLHNERHDPPAYRKAIDRTKATAETCWHVAVYDTPDCGILHEHHLGPFAWPENTDVPEHLCPAHSDTDAGQTMAWSAEQICDLWPALRATVIAANRQTAAARTTDRW